MERVKRIGQVSLDGSNLATKPSGAGGLRVMQRESAGNISKV